MTKYVILAGFLMLVSSQCAAQSNVAGAIPDIRFDAYDNETLFATPEFELSGAFVNITALALVRGKDGVAWSEAEFSKLAALKRLRFLRVESDLTDRGLLAICSLKQLTHLDVSGNNLTLDGFAKIGDLENLEYLRVWYYGGAATVSSPKLVALLTALGRCMKLSKLSLDGRFDISEIGKAPLLTRLRGLRIEDLEEKEGDEGQYDPLRKAESLEELELPLRVNSRKKWQIVSSLPKLKILHVPYSGLTLEVIAADFLPKCAALEVLDCVPEIGDQVLAVLPKLARLKALRLGSTPPPPLRLPSEPKTPRPIPNLGPIVKIASLRYLWAQANDSVTDAFLESLADENRIEFIDVSDCRNVSDAGLKAIGRMTVLTGLVLSRQRQSSKRVEPNYTVEGLTHLGKLKALRYLAMADSPVTTAGVSFIGELGELRELTLSACQSLTGEVFDFIAKCRNLEMLNFDYCRWVDGVGIRKLAALENLVELHVRGCEGITNESFPVFEKMTRLRRLAVYGTSMTVEGAQAFQKKRPDCLIF